HHSLMTHRHPAAQAASAAFAAGIAVASEGAKIKTIVSHMITAAVLFDKKTAELIQKAWLYTEVRQYPKDVLAEWEGWTGDEAIAALVYCFAKHKGLYKSSVLEAVNSPGDSDSLGAITGALAGAYRG